MPNRLTFPDWWEQYHKYGMSQSFILKELWDFKEGEFVTLEKVNYRLKKRVRSFEIFIKKGKECQTIFR